MNNTKINKKETMKVLDMTIGNPMPLILSFAIPLFIGNIFQQIYTMVDTMVVGHHLGDQAIAAIGATSALYGLIINFASGMNNGYGIVVTRYFGAHKEKEMKQSIAGMFLLNTVITLILTALALMFLRPLLSFMNTPDGIFEAAYMYIAIICGGMISTIYYNMFAAILRAIGNSRSPLYFLIIACLINVILDILLVMVLPFGIAGAAIATVVAQTVSAVLCGIYLFRNYHSILPKRCDFQLPGALLSDLFSTGFAMALMICVVDLGSLIFQRANNMLGETFIAAHTASRRIISIMMQPFSTLSTANSTFISQNWGAGKPERIKQTLKKVLLIEILWTVFACILIYLLGSLLVRFTTGTSDPETIRNAVLSLHCHFTLLPVLAILLCLRTSMQAMGRKVAPVISSCIELAMKVFSASWLIPKLGFLGTCITEPITWTLMTIFLVTVFMAERKKLFPSVSE